MAETTRLETEWAALRPSVDALAKSATALKKVAAALSGPEGYESLSKVHKAIERLETLDGLPPPLLDAARAAAAPVADWLANEWSQRAETFIDDLLDHLTERRVPAEARGTLVTAPPLTLRVEPAHDRAAWLYAGEPLKEKLPLVPERVFRERELALNRLRKAQAAPSDLARQLRTAHALLAPTPGTKVRLTDLHFQLFVARQSAQSRTSLTKDKIKPYPRAQFAFDLSALLQSPPPDLHFDPAPASTADSRTAALRVTLEDGTTTAYATLRLLSAPPGT